jgi:hypothetical protein
LKSKAFNVVVPPGESDVYIASRSGDFIAISGDSDFLYHVNIETVARLRGNTIQWLSKNELSKKLSLSPKHLCALAIVSGNDYSKNAKGIGIRKAYDIISKRLSKIKSVKEIVIKFCDIISVPASFYYHATTIFIALKERIAKDSVDHTIIQKLREIQAINLNISVHLPYIVQRVHDSKEFCHKMDRSHICIPPFHNPYTPLQLLGDSDRYSYRNMSIKNANPRAFDDGIIDPEVPADASPEQVKEAKKRFSKVKLKLEKEKEKKRKKCEKGSKSNKKKNKKVKIKASASSKSSRNAPILKERTKKPRTRSEENLVYDSLTRKFGMRTRKLGTLGSRMTSKNKINSDERLYFKGCIQNWVRFMHQVESNGLLLAEAIIKLLFATDNALQMTCSPGYRKRNNISNFGDFWAKLHNDIDDGNARTKFLKMVRLSLESFSLDDLVREVYEGRCKGVGGLNFWQRVCQLIKEGRLYQSKMKLPIIRIMECFPCLHLYLVQPEKNKSVTKLLNICAERMDREFAAQVVGKLPHLCGKVIDHFEGDECEGAMRDTLVKILEGNETSIVQFLKVNELLPKTTRLEIMPKLKFTQSFYTLSELQLLEMVELGKISGILKEIAIDVKNNPHDKLNFHIGSLIQALFGANIGCTYGTVSKDSAHRFILTKSIQTNGFEISVMVLDKKTKPPPKAVKSEASIIDQAKVLSRPRKLISDSIPGIFFQDPFKVKIVGIDVGQRYAIGCCVNQGDPRVKLAIKRSLTIKTSALSEPSDQFRNFLNSSKNNWIFNMEKSLQPLRDESPSDWMKRRNQIAPILFNFYNSKKMMRARYNLGRAKRGEFDYATHRVLKMVDTNITWKADHVNNPVLFVFGDCHVGIGTYSAFEKHLIAKLRSLGHICIFESEYNTSQACPDCHAKVLEAGKGVRIKKCINCHAPKEKYMHRDVMAGGNLSRIGLLRLLGKARPGYLLPDHNSSSEDLKRAGRVTGENASRFEPEQPVTILSGIKQGKAL